MLLRLMLRHLYACYSRVLLSSTVTIQLDMWSCKSICLNIKKNMQITSRASLCTELSDHIASQEMSYSIPTVCMGFSCPMINECPPECLPRRRYIEFLPAGL